MALSARDHGRLNRMFVILRRHKIAAVQDFSCCQTCGCYAMGVRLGKHSRLIGYAFYHHQDKTDLEKFGDVYIAFGSATREQDDDQHIGELIVAAARQCRIRAHWTGRTDVRVHLQFQARRKRGSNEVS